MIQWWNSPYINHFIQPDSIVPGYGNPQNLNRYSYVNNNPIRYTDPTGHAAVGDTNEAGCSGGGTACIIDMYSGYGDDDGMMDSLRNYVRRNEEYDPVADPELTDEDKAIVSIAMFQVVVQDTPRGTSLWDIIRETFPSAASISIFGIINEGINMSPDDGGGGGWSTGRGPKNATEQAAWNKITSNPWNGKQLPLKLNDPRWPSEDGWVKMERSVDGVTIHWNLNKFTGAVEDMKIK